MPDHKELLKLLINQDRSLTRIYSAMARELALVLKKYKVHSNSKLWFKNAAVKKEVDVILGRYQKTVLNYISRKSTDAWNMSEKHNDSFVSNYVKGITLPNSAVFYQRNNSALKAFLKRQSNGFTLSDRVWNLSNQTRSQIDYFIAEGLTTGRSANDLAKDLQRYLKRPEKRFRRLRDKTTGKLKLSDPAKGYHPGRGVYRSSFKNASRLARNEINIAYRSADTERRKRLPFVTGIEVHLSQAHPKYDICDELVGKYPKDFVFTGWHPNCLCFTTALLMPKEKFKEYLRSGNISKSKYINLIPLRAKRHLNKNSEKIKNLNNKPFFIADNFKETQKGFALKDSISKVKTIDLIKEEDLLISLKSESIHVSYIDKEAVDRYNKNLKGFNLKTMFSELESELKTSGIINIKKEVYFNDDNFVFVLQSSGFKMKRKISYENSANSVYHSYLKIPKDEQGKGLSKRLFQKLYKQYIAAGVSRINVNANIDIGGYAWAKYCFSAINKFQILRIINNSRDKNFRKIAKRKLIYHYKRYGDSKPFPMSRLANIKGGKAALMGSDWDGTIDLTNEKERNQFLEYLFL